MDEVIPGMQPSSNETTEGSEGAENEKQGGGGGRGDPWDAALQH